jgi:hypothetical protein
VHHRHHAHPDLDPARLALDQVQEIIPDPVLLEIASRLFHRRRPSASVFVIVPVLNVMGRQRGVEPFPGVFELRLGLIERAARAVAPNRDRQRRIDRPSPAGIETDPLGGLRMRPMLRPSRITEYSLSSTSPPITVRRSVSLCSDTFVRNDLSIRFIAG